MDTAVEAAAAVDIPTTIGGAETEEAAVATAEATEVAVGRLTKGEEEAIVRTIGTIAEITEEGQGSVLKICTEYSLAFVKQTKTGKQALDAISLLFSFLSEEIITTTEATKAFVETETFK